MCPGVSFPTTASCSMNRSVDLTQGPLLQPDNLWAGSHPLFCLAPPPLLPGVWQSLARAEGIATPPHNEQHTPQLAISPGRTDFQLFGTAVKKRVRGVSLSIGFTPDLYETKSGP